MMLSRGGSCLERRESRADALELPLQRLEFIKRAATFDSIQFFSFPING